MTESRPTTHMPPPDGSGLCPCCGVPPTELPTTDRLAAVASMVTCTVLDDQRAEAVMAGMAAERRERRGGYSAAIGRKLDADLEAAAILDDFTVPDMESMQPVGPVDHSDAGRAHTLRMLLDATTDDPEGRDALMAAVANDAHRHMQDDRVVRRGSGVYVVGWHDDAEDTVVVSVWTTQEDAERDRDELVRTDYAGNPLGLVVEGWHGRDRVVLS